MSSRVSSSVSWGIALIVLGAASASAQPGIPDPAKSSVPDFIKIGGMTTSTGDPDPSVTFTITFRDFASNPVPNARIVLDFAACTDTRICSATVGAGCEGGSATVTGLTDANGQATFSILGAAMNWGGDPCPTPPRLCPGAAEHCITVYTIVNGDPQPILLGHATAVVYDEDGALSGGAGGVNAGDLAKLKADVAAYGLLGAPAYRGRSDLTTDHAINSADVARMKSLIALAGLGLGSGAGCVSGGTAAPFCP